MEEGMNSTAIEKLKDAFSEFKEELGVNKSIPVQSILSKIDGDFDLNEVLNHLENDGYLTRSKKGGYFKIELITLTEKGLEEFLQEES